MHRITIQAIAEHVGVSKFAVSRALAGKSGVSEETRREILKGAAELGYTVRPRRRPAARQLLLFMAEGDVVNVETLMGVQRGAEMAAARQGYTAVARWTSNPGHLANLGPACGLIMIGQHPLDMLEAARRTGLPMVLMNNGVRIAPPVDFVGVDNRESGAFMAEHLVSLGHREVAYAHGEGGRFGRLERLEGLKDILRAVPGSHIHELEFGDKEQLGFRRALGALLARGIGVSAFFCGSDGVAITVVSELLRLGVRIPEEVSVVGAADYACATQIAPQLTTVRVPKDEMGAEAVRLVLARTKEAQPSASRKVLLSQPLVRRASSAPAAAPAWAARVATILAAESTRAEQQAAEPARTPAEAP